MNEFKWHENDHKYYDKLQIFLLFIIAKFYDRWLQAFMQMNTIIINNYSNK